DRDGLDAAGGEAAADLLPEQRRELVADDAVEQAAGLLRVDAVHRDLAGTLERVEHAALGDLVERDAPDLLGGDLQRLHEMPGDGLALAVRVGREEDGFGGARDGAQLLERLLLLLDDAVLRFEVVVDVDAETPLREIPDVAHAGPHDELRAQDLV